jgi:hypothetical protein
LLLDVLTHLYNIETSFDMYMGVKKANEQINQLPIGNTDIKKVKEFCLEREMKVHNSGEVPVPSNFADYKCARYFDFYDNFTRVSVKPKDLCKINNPRDEALHAEAVELFRAKHYHGSIEEAHDLRTEYCIQQSIQLRAEADMECLLGLDDRELPKGCSITIMTLTRDVWDIQTKQPVKVTEIVLTIRNFDALLEIVQFDLFSHFTHRRSKYGTPLRIETTYELDLPSVMAYETDDRPTIIVEDSDDEDFWDFGDVPDPCEYTKGHSYALSYCLECIDRHPAIKEDPESLKTVMFHMMEEFKANRDPSLAGITIPNYFNNNGLEGLFDEMYADELYEAHLDEQECFIDDLHEESYTFAG